MSQTTQYTTNLPGLDFIERGIIWKKKKKKRKQKENKVDITNYFITFSLKGPMAPNLQQRLTSTVGSVRMFKYCSSFRIYFERPILKTPLYPPGVQGTS